MQLTFPIVTSAAIVDSFNPCAISVLLLTLGFLASLNKTRKEVFLIAGMYIVGIYLVYISIGFGILRALSFFGIPQGLSKFGAVIIILAGVINLLGEIFPKFPIKLVIPELGKPTLAKFIHKASVPAAFVLGVLVGLFEFPCTGGPYLLILSLLHDDATILQGATYLVYYNLIFVAPLVLILIIGSSKPLLSRFQSWRKTHSHATELFSALAMILLGVIIFIV